MPQQLIFTSAVRGIAPGSSGYCTVARSVEMREGLVARLEQLSVYQHFPNGTNPTILSHRVLSLRSAIFHVLSRITDAGLDYTNRTNFIAHHVVFQPHEIHGACSPAEFLLHWPGWLGAWEGEPAWTDDQSVSLHSVQAATTLPAEYWQGWTGDARNAALLLGSTTAQDALLIVEPGQESSLTYLFAESTLLLGDQAGDKNNKWQVPFTTFFQSKDEVADFRWRGIWPNLSRTKAERGALVLDITNPSAFPPALGPLAEWAVSGVAPTAVSKIEITPEIVGQGAEIAEEAPSITSASQPTAAQSVRPISRKRSSATQTEKTEEVVLEPWYWRWKLAILAGLAVLALALGIGVAALANFIGSAGNENSMSSRGYSGSTTNQNPQLTTAPSTPVPASPINSAHISTSSNSASAPPLPGTTFLANTPKAKVDITGKDFSDKPVTVQPAPKTLDKENDYQITDALSAMPTGTVYVIFELQDNSGGITLPTLPDAVIADLIKWNDPKSLYSLTYTNTGNKKSIASASPMNSSSAEKKFDLEFDRQNLRFIRFNGQRLTIDGANRNETFFIQFHIADAPVSLIICAPPPANYDLQLSKALVDYSATGISLNKILRQALIDHWHFFAPDGQIINLTLRLTTSGLKRTLSSDAQDNYSITWGGSVAKVEDKIKSEKQEMDALQQEKGRLTKVVNDLQQISFSNLTWPLQLKTNNVQSMTSFLASSDVSFNPKTDPILILYAKKLLANLIRADGEDIPKVDPSPITQDVTVWKHWLTNVVPEDLKKGEIPSPSDDQDKKVNQSIEDFCRSWTTEFNSDVLSDSALWELDFNPSSKLEETTSRLLTLNKSISDDENASKPIGIDELQAVELVVQPQLGSTAVPVITFTTAQYRNVSLPTLGGPR